MFLLLFSISRVLFSVSRREWRVCESTENHQIDTCLSYFLTPCVVLKSGLECWFFFSFIYLSLWRWTGGTFKQPSLLLTHDFTCAVWIQAFSISHYVRLLSSVLIWSIVVALPSPGGQTVCCGGWSVCPHQIDWKADARTCVYMGFTKSIFFSQLEKKVDFDDKFWSFKQGNGYHYVKLVEYCRIPTTINELVSCLAPQILMTTW